MQIAHIYPINNQKFYGKEKFVMILAHLVAQKLYEPKNFSSGQYVIMDNGLYENAQISTRLEDCVALAESSKIPVAEIVVPDCINDLKGTMQLFLDNIATIRKWQHKYRFMFVAQATSYGELHAAIKFINGYSDLNLSVGISKLTPLDRADKLALRCYRECKLPIHFLGIKKTFEELSGLTGLIRSCDTSQIVFIAKNERNMPRSIVRYVRRGRDINLESDTCGDNRIEQLLSQFNAEVADGLLR